MDRNVCQRGECGDLQRQKAYYALGVLGHGLLTAVDTAALQRTTDYQPHYPFGQALSISETLLTSTLAGLFFLAVRRRFRR